jgi:pimeloyl-ACP methyl ester carboxylesterase
LAAFVLLASYFAPADAAVPCTDPAACRTTLTFENLALTLYVSAPLDAPSPAIHRAVVVIHGADGNADSYFRTMTKAAAMAGKAAETLVVAPHFVEQRDVNVPRGQLLWSRGADWHAGDLSMRDVTPRVSSFAVIDRILARLADARAFPNLTSIVLAGHSAGAQFVQRYAVAEREDPAVAPRMLYVVANPSSFLYLDARRPDPARPGSFRVPTDARCEANRFKYGFEQANAYFQRESPPAMTERYRARRVIYLAGERDTDPQHKMLDRNCAAMAQGATRFARTQAFMTYMDAFYAPHAHRLMTVPGVGHSARGMFQSERGLAVLFE